MSRTKVNFLFYILGEFLGDIAIPPSEQTTNPKAKKSALQEEVEKYKQEVLEGLQIEEEGLTDYIRKKTKQPVPSNYNDPFDSLSVDPSHKNGQILKPTYSGSKAKFTKTENENGDYSLEEATTSSYTHNVNNTGKKPGHQKDGENLHKRKKRHQNKHRRR